MAIWPINAKKQNVFFHSCPAHSLTEIRMGIFDIFNIHKNNGPAVKSAGATFYPDKIVLETVDRIKDLYGVTSVNVTVLHSNADSALLGITLRHHLEQSRDNIKKPKDIDDGYKQYLEAAGLRNIKEHYWNALHLIISQEDNVITLTPTRNGGPTGKTRGFANSKEEPLILDATVSDQDLGDAVLQGWAKCVCNYP